MRLFLSFIVVPIVLAMLSGCAVAQKESLLRGQGYYASKSYDKAIACFNNARSYAAVDALMHAHLMLLEGICHEEAGNTKAADEVYLKLSQQFPGTTYGDRGANRLKRLEASQGERLLLELDTNRWSRIQVNDSLGTIKETYKSKNNEKLSIATALRPGQRQSIQETMSYFHNELTLRCPDVQITPHHGDSERALFAYRIEACKNYKKEYGVILLITSETANHIVTYFTSDSLLYQSTMPHWLRKLRNPVLTPSPARKTPRTKTIALNRLTSLVLTRNKGENLSIFI